MARKREPGQYEDGNDNGQGEVVRLRGLNLQDSLLGESGFAKYIVVAGTAGHVAKVQFDLVAMTVKRLVIGKRMKVKPEALHRQER